MDIEVNIYTCFKYYCTVHIVRPSMYALCFSILIIYHDSLVSAFFQHMGTSCILGFQSIYFILLCKELSIDLYVSSCDHYCKHINLRTAFS